MQRKNRPQRQQFSSKRSTRPQAKKNELASAEQLGMIELFIKDNKRLIERTTGPYAVLATGMLYLALKWQHDSLADLEKEYELDHRLADYVIAFFTPFASRLIIGPVTNRAYARNFILEQNDQSKSITNYEADEEIARLIKLKYELLPYAKKSTLVSIVAFVLLLVFSIYLLTTSEEQLSMPKLFMLSYFLVRLCDGALADVVSGINQNAKVVSLNDELKRLYNLLLETFPTGSKCKLKLGGELNRCHFKVFFSRYKHCSARSVTHVVKKILTESGIEFTSSDHASIRIQADAKLDRNTAQNIKNKIESELKRLIQLKKFSKQLCIIADEMRRVDIAPRYKTNKNGELVLQTYLNIPPEFKKLINAEVLSKLFPGSKIKVINEDVLKLSGYMSANDEMHKKLINSIRSHVINHSNTSYSFGSLPCAKEKELGSPRTSKSKHRSQNNFQESKKEKIIREKEEAKRSQQQLSSIQWNSGKFDPSKKDNKVVPLTGCSYPANKIFLLFSLKNEDLAKYPGAYNGFKSSCDKGKIAPRRKGAQGLVFLKESEKGITVKDANGNSFKPAAKLKVLGVFGKMRAYAEEEKSESGQKLYVVKGFVADH